MQRYEKTQGGDFPPFVTPRFFFKYRALVTFIPYGALTSWKKLEKTNGRLRDIQRQTVDRPGMWMA